MKSFTVWLKQPDVTLFIGGDPEKGEAPVITGKLDNPQILLDLQRKTITIIATK